MAEAENRNRLLEVRPPMTPSKVSHADWLDEFAQGLSEHAYYDEKTDTVAVGFDPNLLAQIISILKYIASEVRPA